MFNLFQQVTTSSITTMRINRLLIKSIHFPRESLVLANLLRTLFSHIFEIIIFIIIAVFLGVSFKGLLFYIPILVDYSVFLYGFSLILASLYLYFIDLENIWVFISRLVFFATPIFYAVEGQTRLFYVNLLNPIYYFMEITRKIIIYREIPHPWLIQGAVIYSLISIIIGLFIFKKLKKKFAELI